MSPARTLKAKHFDTEPTNKGKKSMNAAAATENLNKSVNNDIDGLRRAVRMADENHYQTMGLVSKLREELDIEKAKVQRLVLQMDEVYKYLKANKN